MGKKIFRWEKTIVKNINEIKGVITAMSTPFNDDESLNLAVVPELVDKLIGDGVGGIFACGSMSEAFSMDFDEKIALCKAAVKAVNGRVPFIMGTSSNTTREVIALNERLADEGVDAFSVLSPIYWQTSQEEIYAHFCDIIDVPSVPVIAYNIPRNTVNNIDPETIGRLYRDKGLVGAKDSSGSFDNFSGYIKNTGDSFLGIVGSDALILKGLQIGAKGAISAPSNMLTKVVCAIYDRFIAGDMTGAQEAQSDWDAILAALRDIGTFPACFKYAVNHFTANVGIPRRPLRPASKAKFDAILPRLLEYKEKYY